MVELEPIITLKQSQPMTIAAFFHWYCGAGHLNMRSTLMTYWHTLNQQGNIYRGGGRLPDQQLKEITTVKLRTILRAYTSLINTRYLQV